MDFAAQLAKLEQSASAARRRPSPNPRPRQRPRHYEPDSNPLQRLEKLGMRFDYVKQFQIDHQRPPHICFLAITIDDLPYLDIWKAFWKDADCYVSLVCHAKYPSRVTSDYLKSHLILEPPKLGRGNTWADPVYRTHTPQWGSIEIVRAMKDVLTQGLQIGHPEPHASDWPEHQRVQRYVVQKPKTLVDGEVPPVDKFIYVSETCLPVQTMAHVQTALFGETKQSSKAEQAEAEEKTSETRESKETTDTDSKPAVADTNDGNEDDKAEPASATKESDGKPDGAKEESTPTEKKDDLSSSVDIQVDIWDVSWINARNQNMPGTPRNLYERDQFAKIRNIAGIFRWKADQWIILSRLHAEAINHIDCHLPVARQLWRSFNFINAADEMYFATALSVLGYLKQEDTDTIAKRPVTYTNWTEGMKNPKSHFAKDLNEVIKVSREQGSLFARKFEGAITVEEWKKAMEQQP